MEKVKVRVECQSTDEGPDLPKTVIWTDGRRFNIDRVLFYGVSQSGEYEGIRYTVIIGSAEKYIYRVNHEWYVMALSGGVSGEETHYL